MRRIGIFGLIRKLWGELDNDQEQQRLGHLLRKLGGEEQQAREPPYIVRRGILVVLRTMGELAHRYVELKATIVVSTGHRFLASRNWDSIPAGVRAPPSRELAAAIAIVERGEHPYVVFDDGIHVTAHTDLKVDRATLDALIDAVVAIARFDDGLTETLLALPDAVPLEAHELDPGVSFGEDGLVLGVRKGEVTIAQLDGFPATPAKASVRDGEVTGDELTAATIALLRQAGDGDLHVTSKAARYTWTRLVRDRDELLAGVRALRSLRASVGPYR